MSAAPLSELDAALPGLSSALYRRSAEAFAAWMQPELDRFFGAGRITVVLDPTLAEPFTGSMDINRLRRLALRVLAVQQALDGADFIQVFEGFLAAGQSQEESFRSTQRIFRGADLHGGSAFTKNAAYLTGLLGVHTLLRIAIRDNRPELVGHLFAGRLSLGDTVRLAPLFESGWLQGPAHLPAWASDLRLLAANLAFSAFIARIKLDVLDLEVLMAFADEHETNASAM